MTPGAARRRIAAAALAGALLIGGCGGDEELVDNPSTAMADPMATAVAEEAPAPAPRPTGPRPAPPEDQVVRPVDGYAEVISMGGVGTAYGRAEGQLPVLIVAFTETENVPAVDDAFVEGLFGAFPISDLTVDTTGALSSGGLEGRMATATGVIASGEPVQMEQRALPGAGGYRSLLLIAGAEDDAAMAELRGMADTFDPS